MRFKFIKAIIKMTIIPNYLITQCKIIREELRFIITKKSKIQIKKIKLNINKTLVKSSQIIANPGEEALMQRFLSKFKVILIMDFKIFLTAISLKLNSKKLKNNSNLLFQKSNKFKIIRNSINKLKMEMKLQIVKQIKLNS